MLGHPHAQHAAETSLERLGRFPRDGPATVRFRRGRRRRCRPDRAVKSGQRDVLGGERSGVMRTPSAQRQDRPAPPACARPGAAAARSSLTSSSFGQIGRYGSSGGLPLWRELWCRVRPCEESLSRPRGGTLPKVPRSARSTRPRPAGSTHSDKSEMYRLNSGSSSMPGEQ